MNQENRPPLFMTFRKKLENNNEEPSSTTPKRPLLSRDREIGIFNDISPLSDHNSRFEQSKHAPVELIQNDSSPISVVENHMFIISPPPQLSRDNTSIPVYTQRKAKPAPSTTWKAPVPIPKSSTILKTNIESSLPLPELPPIPPINSFQPAIRARIPFNLSSTNTIDKQTHAYTIWLNSLFTPVEFNQSISNETKTLKSLAELNRWYRLRDRAREVFIHDIQSIIAKISVDIDIDHCRINPKSDLNFSGRTVNRQTLLNFISSYNRLWFRLAMEVIFSINIENYQQMKLSIDQYLIPSLSNNKTASIQIRLIIKNLIIIIIFLERIKLLHLIDNGPCLYNHDSKFKSTKESLDILSRDFISSDTNLLRRLKLAGYEPTYKQTSLDEYNYLISNNLFDDLKDGIRLTRCAQILLSSINKIDFSTKLKCPVVNLVHKLLNIDYAFELFQIYGNINLNGIINKDIMNGNKQRILELLWRIFSGCYLSKYLFPIEKLNNEIFILSKNFICSSIEQQIIKNDIIPLQKQQINLPPIIHLLIKWVQLICAYYQFWIYDLQESFSDGRAFLYIISYYLPSLCDHKNDIKHLTTLATCQTYEEHIEFNHELGKQQHLINIYEKNVKSNFRLLEDCIKQFGTFSSELIKYDYYAKDVPDERCTILILAMLAHDLIFLNNDIHIRHELISKEDELLSQSILDTMNYDILDRLELLSEINDDDDDYDSTRSRIDHIQRSIAATISLDDFVELEKTIEKEENQTINRSLFLSDETISSENDRNELNKFDEER